jgi:hypothetical protein
MYNGMIAEIPMGSGGLHTDDNQDQIPPTDLIWAENVSIKYGYVQKDFGARRFNFAALPSPIYSIIDYWADVASQYVVAVCQNGDIYQINQNGYKNQLVTVATNATPTLSPDIQTHMVIGGMELAGRAKKLFIFDKNDQVQVITGSSGERHDITNPPTEWVAGNYPTIGLMHNGRIYSFGCANDPHLIFSSDPTDQENYVSDLANSYSVFAGESERLIGGASYKGQLLVFKYPLGMYQLIDSDPDPVNWYFAKVTDTVGAASGHPAVGAIDDMLLANSNGSVSSLMATLNFGDFKQGDLFNSMRVLKFVQENFRQDGIDSRKVAYYQYKNIVYLTYSSSGGPTIDRMMVIDYSNPQAPRISFNSAYQANAMAIKKDIRRIQRLAYGGNDGYVYEVGTENVFVDRNVGGTAYKGAFQTPHMNFGWMDSTNKLDELTKVFDHLEVVFAPSQSNGVSVDVYIDNDYSETIEFKQTSGDELGNFTLGESRLYPRGNRDYMKPLHGTGRRISFYCYNSNLNESFRISSLKVYFRVGGNQQKGT